MTFLSKLFARREFSLPQFDLAPLAFELGATADDDGELILDRVVSAGEGESNVVALSRPLQTARELHESIERHLRNAGEPSTQPVDATDELRAALADLRSSLG